MTGIGRRSRTRPPGFGRVLATLGVLATLVSVPPAHAGSYDVVACGGPAGAAQYAFTASADSMMSAYSICPPSSAVGTGIVTKATSNGGKAPPNAGAYQIFAAPPGATVATVTFNVGAIRLSKEWTAGIVAYDGDFFGGGTYPYGCYPWNDYCGVGTPVFSTPVTVSLYNRSRFRFETRCVSSTGCDLSASGFSPGNRALFSAANVTVRVEDWWQPAVTPHHGDLWNGGWHRGHEQAWSSYTDNVGIMITRLYVDGVPREVQDYRDVAWGQYGVRCDFTRPRPCVDVVPGSLTLDTSTLADGRHEIRVEAVDAAGLTGGVDHSIDVDNTPPGKATDVVVEGGEDWRSLNGYTVRWTNPGGQVAPIAKAHYRICRAGDGAGCSEGTVAAERIDGLAALSLPGPGDYTLRVWLEDAAGNEDSDRASDPVRLRFDDEAPVALFEAQDPDHPTWVAVAVGDRGSGVASGSLEIRGVGRSEWLDVGASLHGDRLVGEIDDLSLPDGSYELRSQVRDRAGNERTGDRRQDGSKMELRLPLRLSSRVALAAGRAPRGCRPGRSNRCGGGAGERLEVKGRQAFIRGLLQSAAGDPIPLAYLAVSEQLRTGGAFERLTTARSDMLGRFTFRVRPGPSRTVRFHYAGTAHVKPASGDVRMLVPASSSIATDRRSVLNGRAVAFHGALRGGHVPAGGKLIDLQAFYRGGWRTFATPRTDGLGRWSYRYRFGATRGVIRYRFRARIRREAAYPFELGYSRVVRVVVRG
jgi:hypothetical protein